VVSNGGWPRLSQYKLVRMAAALNTSAEISDDNQKAHGHGSKVPSGSPSCCDYNMPKPAFWFQMPRLVGHRANIESRILIISTNE